MLKAFTQEEMQVNLLSKYFAQKLNTQSEMIEVEIIHSPEINHELFKNQQVQVQRGRGKFNLGHQTLWLVHKENGVIRKRYPVTIQVYANLVIPTANRRIERLETLSEDIVSLRLQRVGREYLRLATDVNLIYGKMGTQLIKEDRPIEKNMFRTRPDILLGDDVQILLISEGLSLELPGVAKEEGLIGESIRVQCPSTRKEFSGILMKKNEVAVSLR